MKNSSVHAMLMALVGGYVLYIAYQLFDKLQSGAEEMPFWLCVAAIAFFALAGLAVILYAWKLWRDGKQEEQINEDEELK